MLNILSKTIQADTFFSTPKRIQLFRIRNKNGIEAVITNYGLRLISLHTPDKNGNLDDIVLGYDTLHEFETKNPFMNSIIGRVANRIDKGQFTINGEKFQVNTNLGKHCLHGGYNGLHKQTWEVKSSSEQQLHFYHYSKSGSEGFPGNLEINVSIQLTDKDELKLNYQVTTDQATPINLTYHPYFNLSGTKNSKIVNHLLQIFANEITETDHELVPNGNYVDIKNSPFDFRNGKKIGKDIDAPIDAIKKCGGYDHNFVLKKEASTTPFLAAILADPSSGRKMEIWTTQPGIQLYTSNGVSEIGKGNQHYGDHSAVCLEPQHFPNSPNLLHFPNMIISPVEAYDQTCIFKFGLI